MELNEVCARCNKSVTIPADPDLMKLKIEEEADVTNVIAQCQELAENFDGPLPEVVTFLRKEDDDGNAYFEIKALPKLCGPDAKKKRNKGGCLNRVQMLVDDIHRVSRGKKKTAKE